MGHIVFGGNDRRVFTRLRKACAFVAVYPLFERGHAPRFRVVEIVVQCADQLRKGCYQCPVICCVLFSSFVYLLFLLFNHISRFARLSSNVGATHENNSPSLSR